MSLSSPSVWIIVLGWNGCQDTVDCLYSLQHLDYPKCNVLFVDNGSTDGTVSAVRAQFPRVRILENGKNLGFAQGNNVGIRYALNHNADYIFLLNNDATVEPDTLARLVEIAESDARIGMLCPTITSYFDRTKHYVGARIFWDAGVGVEIERSTDGLPETLDTDYAPGCALLIKSSVIRQIGLLDPDYFAYFEDVDWSLRCSKAGSRVVVVPKAVAYHKGTMDRMAHKSTVAEFYFKRNQVLFMRKYAKWHHWLPFLRHYIRKSLERFQQWMQAGETDYAWALVDGWWAGIAGKYGAERAQAPSWFRKLVDSRLNLLLWLTGWLYFWDYQKVKRDKSKERLELNRANRPLP
jgi:GT2 family glycosyltransferase